MDDKKMEELFPRTEEEEIKREEERQEKCNKIIHDVYHVEGIFSFYNLEVAIMALAEATAQEYKDVSPESSKVWHIRALKYKQFITGNEVKSTAFYESLVGYKDFNAHYKRKCEICSMESTSVFEPDEPCSICGSYYVTAIDKPR